MPMLTRSCPCCGDERAFETPPCGDGHGPDCAELPVSRRHTRELKDRLVRATKQAWSQR